ncbi:M48 family metalloprotease [Motiliproteus sp. MSK22-1]|uniref:M48 family metalloprotease n=1 Tax=Motiliproteus sp. MSK22-1 TaxID=1897630 RepID=UPI00097561DA|nr:M48 family metalloprotease [Motiliproteus sp. MSK22-1]OMH39209.1 peptidase M48 [Motiliproteus sp. MSK22-1]
MNKKSVNPMDLKLYLLQGNSIKTKLISALVLFAIIATTGCATNPVTGKQELSLVSEQWEITTGQQQYLPMRQSQGGDYVADPKVEAYVKEVGQRLAAVSDRKLPYEFNVLNNSVPNAWALPGGKISINRGLLTELKSEAELAAVLGHEIVHAAAKHGAQGMQRGLLLQGAVVGASIATQGEEYANLAQMGATLGAQLVNTKYGRDAERESDQYGMQYMSRAGYSPLGAVELQRTFVKMSEGKQQSWLEGMLSSHPASQERVENNIRMAAQLPGGGEVGKARYQQVMAHLNKTEAAYSAYDKAQKALNEGDKKTARSLVKKAISIEPKEGHFYSLLGDIEYGEKRYKSAHREYDRAIKLNEEFFYYHLRRGLVNQKLNNDTRAKMDLERSTQLLPTASAYNALGNLSRDSGDLAAAKAYFAKAAQNSDQAGKQAYASLVEIDLPENPENYLKLRNISDGLGRWLIEISNPTPKDVSSVIVQIEYPDKQGRMRSSKRRISGVLAAGSTQRLNTRILINPALVDRYGSSIADAKIVNN